jgi:hypothetical protein
MRNLAILWINAQDLITIIGLLGSQLNSVRPICSNLPAGAIVRGVDYDFGRQSFAVLLEHESFAKVPDGDEIPWLDMLDVQIEASPIANPIIVNDHHSA